LRRDLTMGITRKSRQTLAFCIFSPVSFPTTPASSLRRRSEELPGREHHFSLHPRSLYEDLSSL
jgi:hypothetical protein